MNNPNTINQAEKRSHNLVGAFSIDVEDWFHLLDCSSTPDVTEWQGLESRIDRNMNRLLELLSEYDRKATFFWLGWVAERHVDLVRRCVALGHEVASHSYKHLLAYKVGRNAFREDIRRGKHVVEDICGCSISGFRAPGFGIKSENMWAFEEIASAGFVYDSSIFPAIRGHGGIPNAPVHPFCINTPSGLLYEFPIPMVEVFGMRLNFFGGGYLRLAPIPIIEWGIAKLSQNDNPLIVYLHPREIDPDQPRLPISLVRRFKSYINIGSTEKKIRWLLCTYPLGRMVELVDNAKTTCIELTRLSHPGDLTH